MTQQQGEKHTRGRKLSARDVRNQTAELRRQNNSNIGSSLAEFLNETPKPPKLRAIVQSFVDHTANDPSATKLRAEAATALDSEHAPDMAAEIERLRKALKDLERAAWAHLGCTDGSEREYLCEELNKARTALGMGE